MHISCSLSLSLSLSLFYTYKKWKKLQKNKSRLFSTRSVLVPGNCSVDGYDDEDLINFFLSCSRISSFKIKMREVKRKRERERERERDGTVKKASKKPVKIHPAFIREEVNIHTASRGSWKGRGQRTCHPATHRRCLRLSKEIMKIYYEKCLFCILLLLLHASYKPRSPITPHKHFHFL